LVYYWPLRRHLLNFFTGVQMLEHPLFLCDDPDVQRREKLESPPPQLIAQF